jgi:hypothetical protein
MGDRMTHFPTPIPLPTTRAGCTVFAWLRGIPVLLARVIAAPVVLGFEDTISPCGGNSPGA